MNVNRLHSLGKFVIIRFGIIFQQNTITANQFLSSCKRLMRARMLHKYHKLQYIFFITSSYITKSNWFNYEKMTKSSGCCFRPPWEKYSYRESKCVRHRTFEIRSSLLLFRIEIFSRSFWLMKSERNRIWYGSFISVIY